MNRRRITLRLAAAMLLAASTLSAQIWTAAEGTSITVSGTSTLHDWQVESKKVEGSVSTEQGFFETGTPTPKVLIEIPAKSLLSDKDKMNKLMWNALEADSHPKISYELTSVQKPTATHDGFTVRTSGNLTIAGTTRPIEMLVKATRENNRTIFEATVPIRMTQFGVKPPTAMLGTIRTGDEVKVSFRWVTTQR